MAIAEASTGMVIDPGRGIYDANRASALAGVPRSTLHYWARHGIVRPGVSPDPRTRLWNWGDLLLLRLVHWLRADKPEAARTGMPEVRAMVASLERSFARRDEALSRVQVTRDGRIVLDDPDHQMLVASGQILLSDVLELVKPFGDGPDLLRPAKGMRIIPGKLSGEPHVEGTRIPTRTIYELFRAGYLTGSIVSLFPELSLESVESAISLEAKLAA